MQLTSSFLIENMTILPRIVPTAMVLLSSQQISEIPPYSKESARTCRGLSESSETSNKRRDPISSEGQGEICMRR